MKCSFCVFPFPFPPVFEKAILAAEKGGYGDEEGWGQGTDHDDIILGCPFHCSVCSGLSHLGQRGRNQSAIAYTRKRVLRFRSNVGLDEGV